MRFCACFARARVASVLSTGDGQRRSQCLIQPGACIRAANALLDTVHCRWRPAFDLRARSTGHAWRVRHVANFYRHRCTCLCWLCVAYCCFCQNSRPHLPVPARPDADCSFLTLIRTQLAAEEEELRSLFMTKEQLVTYAEMLHQAHQGYTCPLFLSVWRYFVLRDRRFCVLFQCKHA